LLKEAVDVFVEMGNNFGGKKITGSFLAVAIMAS
jgi:hypothetical protein